MRVRQPDRFSISSALWRAIDRLDVPLSRVLAEARLPMAVIRDRAGLNTRRYFTFWQALVEVAQDPAIGLRLATELETAALPVATLAAYHARDYREALQRAARYKRLCAPADLVLDERGELMRVSIRWAYADGSAAPHALVDMTLASLLALGWKGSASHFSAHALELSRGSGQRKELESHFGCPVRFGAPQDSLVLRDADLDRGFEGHNDELLAILTPTLDRQLSELISLGQTSEQARWVLRRLLPSGRPDVGAVAKELAMSKRSLQRSLSQEGLTFNELLGATRHELAIDYVANPSLELVEVAYLLGYEDHNSFNRAFRAWEGSTPSAWRSARGSKAVSWRPGLDRR